MDDVRELPDLPPGFVLCITQTPAWVSYGWVELGAKGEVVSAYKGAGSPQEAADRAFEFVDKRPRA